jgi:hypothetical protein
MSWSYTGIPGSTVNIEVLRGGTILKVLPGISVGSGGFGSLNVTIPSSTPLGDDYRIRVTSSSNPTYSDISDGPFTISGPTMTVTMPNGGENFQMGSLLPMNWTYNGNPGSTVKIEVLRSGVLLKTLPGIPIGTSGSGSYSVTIPYNAPLGSDYTIRVTSTTYASCTDMSNGPFGISGPTVTVVTPNGGEIYHLGSSLPMSWTYTGNPGPAVNIEVLRGGTTLKVLPGIPSGTGGSGSYTVSNIPLNTPLASDYQIRVTSTNYSPCSDTSNAPFTISIPG